MSFKALPSQDRLRSLFDYDPHTGILLNKRLQKQAGFKVQGGNSTTPHVCLKVDKVVYTSQRLIWMWWYGKDPGEMIVDHIDRNSLNNRLENLRLVTRSENRRNSKLNRNNSSGFRHVYPMGKRWQAKEMLPGGRSRSLGTFDTPEEAHQAVTRHADSLRQASRAD